jgi:hypothetical protein
MAECSADELVALLIAFAGLGRWWSDDRLLTALTDELLLLHQGGSDCGGGRGVVGAGVLRRVAAALAAINHMHAGLQQRLEGC